MNISLILKLVHCCHTPINKETTRHISLGCTRVGGGTRRTASETSDKLYSLYFKRATLVTIEPEQAYQHKLERFKVNVDFKSTEPWAPKEQVKVNSAHSIDDDMLLVYALTKPPSEQFVPHRIADFPHLCRFPHEVLFNILSIDNDMRKENYAHKLLMTGDRRMRWLLTKGCVKVFNYCPDDTAFFKHIDLSILMNSNTVSPYDFANGTALAHLLSPKGAWSKGITHLRIGSLPVAFHFLQPTQYFGISQAIYRNRMTLVELDISGPLHVLFGDPDREYMTPDRLRAIYAEDYPHLRTLGMACLEDYTRVNASCLVLPPTVTHLKLRQIINHIDFERFVIPYLCNGAHHLEKLELDMACNVSDCVNNESMQLLVGLPNAITLSRIILHLALSSALRFRRPEGPMITVRQLKSYNVLYESGPKKGEVEYTKVRSVSFEKPSYPAGPYEFAMLCSSERHAIQRFAVMCDCKHVTWQLNESIYVGKHVLSMFTHSSLSRPWK